MMQKFKNIPYYFFLLPLFFVWHGVAQNFGFVDLWPATALGVVYYIDATILFLLFYWLLRDIKKASLVAFCCLCFFFFFGNYLDFAIQYISLHLFRRYVFVVPAFLMLIVLLTIYLKKSTNSFTRITLFLNCLLAIYLVVDTLDICRKLLLPYSNKIEVYNYARNRQYTIPETSKKPDIFFLLFDEYESSAGLKQQYNYNNILDSILTQKGFQVQKESHSNYQLTYFSMASMLNMNYLPGIDKNAGVGLNDYQKCNGWLRENEVVKFLGTNGYDIINLSIFDFAGKPATAKQSFLPLQTRMFTGGTLPQRFYRDFKWIFEANKFLSKIAGITSLYMNEESNDNIIQKTKETASANSENGKPRFIYAHFMMPHRPYFKDELGNRRTDSIVRMETIILPAESYLHYVSYVNQEIEKLVTHIQQTTHNNAVIIIMGDHGFRRKDAPIPFQFRNLNAVYLPEKNYNHIYDSISGVNQFRCIFNTLFQQQFPILKDSCIYLKDKEPEVE